MILLGVAALVLAGTLSWTFVQGVRLAERLTAAFEQRAKRPEPPKKPEIPADLLSDALTESEAWAREDRLKALRELYETTGSWERVRQVVHSGGLTT